MFPDEMDKDLDSMLKREEEADNGTLILRDYINLRIKKLNDEDLWKVIDYIRSLNKSQTGA